MALPRVTQGLVAKHLRVSTYLFLLDQAAMTGFLPRLDRYGNPIPGATEPVLKPEDQLKILQYLVDKVIPAPRATEAPPPVDIDAIAQDPSSVRHLSVSQLAELAQSPAPVPAFSASDDADADTPDASAT